MSDDEIDAAHFEARLASQFPEIVAGASGATRVTSPYFYATWLAHVTQSAIDAQEREIVVQHFRFVEDLYKKGTAEVQEAIKVSYLGNLRFDGPKAGPTKARELLPPALARSLSQLEAYLEGLLGDRPHPKSEPH